MLYAEELAKHLQPDEYAVIFSRAKKDTDRERRWYASAQLKRLGAEASDDDDKAGEKSDESMMAGVVPGAAKKDEAKKLLPVTPWGRYLKTLLSSNEFIFVS